MQISRINNEIVAVESGVILPIQERTDIFGFKQLHAMTARGPIPLGQPVLALDGRTSTSHAVYDGHLTLYPLVPHEVPLPLAMHAEIAAMGMTPTQLCRLGWGRTGPLHMPEDTLPTFVYLPEDMYADTLELQQYVYLGLMQPQQILSRMTYRTSSHSIDKPIAEAWRLAGKPSLVLPEVPASIRIKSVSHTYMNVRLLIADADKFDVTLPTDGTSRGHINALVLNTLKQTGNLGWLSASNPQAFERYALEWQNIYKEPLV